MRLLPTCQRIQLLSGCGMMARCLPSSEQRAATSCVDPHGLHGYPHPALADSGDDASTYTIERCTKDMQNTSCNGQEGLHHGLGAA